LVDLLLGERRPARLTLEDFAGVADLDFLVALLAASAGLAGLFDGGGWWWQLVGFGTLLLVVPAVLRTLGVPRVLASLVDLPVYAVVLAAAFGVAPSREGGERLAELVDTAVVAIARDSVPATAVAEILFIIVATGGVIAVLLDLLGATAPALVAVPLFAVVAVRAFFHPLGIDLASLAFLAVAYLLVLWADGWLRGRSRGPAGPVVIAAATVLALGLTVVTPGLEQRWWKGTWFDGGARASSLVDLARDLREASDAEVLRYRTDTTPVPYLQLATLEDYDGTTWVHRDVREIPMANAPARTAPIPPGYGGAIAPVTVDVEITRLNADWAPAPYPALRVEGGAGEWTSASNDYSLRIDGAGLPGQTYRVTSYATTPTPADLGPSAIPIEAVADAEVPAGTPDIVLDTALEVTRDARSDFEAARMLQDWLRYDGGFTYTTTTPDAATDDGMEVVASFLERKSGYCIHFAAAMTVMARSLGIPARIAIGYLPGESVDDPAGGEVYSVSNQELHAWPQLYIRGAGWLAYEPTVGRGSPPAYARDAVETPQPTASPAPTATPRPTSTRGPRDVDDDAPTPAAVRAAGTTRLLWWLGGIVAAALVLLAPATWRALRRRRRVGALRTSPGSGAPRRAGPALAWTEVTDTARDLGIAPEPAETPRAFADRLAVASRLHPGSAPREVLEALLLEVERSAFGPPGSTGGREDLAELTIGVIRSVTAAAPPGIRLLARFAPRSLLGRLPPPRRRA
ncbi:MAG: transglutaminase domain-containing protein, partial [Microbacteriaceae bacterium]|nr:transglutaminase domain-containing protein [Microbacteriaceae bacterium]